MATHRAIPVCPMICYTDAIECPGFCGKFELVPNIKKMWTSSLQANFYKWEHILEVNNHFIKLIEIFTVSSCSTHLHQ